MRERVVQDNMRRNERRARAQQRTKNRKHARNKTVNKGQKFDKRRGSERLKTVRRQNAATINAARSEEADEVAREDVPAGLSPRLVEELAGPPAVLGRRSDGDDVALLEVELFLNRRAVVVHRLDYAHRAVVSRQRRRQYKGHVP